MIQRLTLFLSLLLYSSISLHAQTQYSGLLSFDQEKTEEGYVLWGPINSKYIYLMDNCGNVVHSWNNEYFLGNSVYLLEDGRLLRTTLPEDSVPSVIMAGGNGYGVQITDWEGNLEWDYIPTSDSSRPHHDIAAMPNGNVLILTWEAIGESECIASGRDTALLKQGMIYSEAIYEVRPTGLTTGEVVWEWHLWDHLVQDLDSARKNYGVPAEHPELLNINYVNGFATVGEADWIHSNAVEYNPELDQVMFSSQRLGEIYIIDHTTTSAEAAAHSGGTYGKGGDFLYRWGNEAAYGHGSLADQQLFGLHNCNWIPGDRAGSGQIIIFNNGLYGRGWSTIDVIDPPQSAPGFYILDSDTTFGPELPSWTYMAPDTFSFNSWFISGVQRQPNGNTLVCSGADGRLFEVDYAGNIVWEYINPTGSSGPQSIYDSIPPALFQPNIVFRAQKYPPDYPAFIGKDLNPKSRVETDDLEINCIANIIHPPSMLIYPNPAENAVTVTIDNLSGNDVSLEVFDVRGKRILLIEDPAPQLELDISGWIPGMYILRLGTQYAKLIRQR